jgi:RNA polymerase sigma-70 factor (ECF subfamily)
MSDERSPTKEQLEALVVSAQGGDTAAFEALYDHFYDRIYRYVSFKAGDASAAEDITEEVFLRMLRSIGTYKHRGHPFSSWLFRVAHNLVADHFRKRGRDKSVPLDKVVAVVGESSVDLDDYVQTKLAMREVNRAMEDLTDLQRQIISLRFAGGLSVNETAKAVGRNENAVKALQHAGIKKLRKILTPGGAPSRQPI